MFILLFLVTAALGGALSAFVDPQGAAIERIPLKNSVVAGTALVIAFVLTKPITRRLRAAARNADRG